MTVNRYLTIIILLSLSNIKLINLHLNYTATVQFNIDVWGLYRLVLVVLDRYSKSLAHYHRGLLYSRRSIIGILYIIFLDVMRNERADAFNNGLKEKLPRTIKHILYKTNA